MKEQTLETYNSGSHAKALFASDAKVGKTTWLIAQALGVFPGQTRGGIVDKPENLHVISFDEAALRGVRRFLLETCKAPPEALNFRIYNCEDDFKKITVTPHEYDRDFYNAIVAVAQKIAERVRGTSVVIPSSLTSIAEGLLRGTTGPAGQKKGAGGDQSKYGDFALQMTEMRNWVHRAAAHVMWEAHIYKRPVAKDGQWGGAESEETLQITGKSGVNFPANVSHVFRVRRMFGQRIPGTNADTVFMDTRAAFAFVANGRGVNESLDAKEVDLTHAFEKLGLSVGGYGARTASPKPTPPTKE